VDDLIRSTIHDALAVEPPPAGLRARVIASVPMDRRSAWRRPTPIFRGAGQWASGFAAVLLALAIIAGLLYSRNVAGTQPGGPQKTPHASPARLISPEGLATAPDGSLYVSDFEGNRVYRLQPDGSLVTVAGGGSKHEGPATQTNISGPAGLVFDQSGNLYIADNTGGTIRRVDRNGMLTTFASFPGLGFENGPAGVAFDTTGVLYVGTFNGEVYAIQPTGSKRVLDLSAVPPPVVPAYLAFDSAGNLYVADRNPQQSGIIGGGCRIIRVKPDRSVSVIAGTGVCGYSGDGGPAVEAKLADPTSIALDSAGNIYVADSNNHRIRRIDSRGIITTVAGTGVAGHTGDGGAAIKAELGYLPDILMVQGQFLYITETCDCAGSPAYGAIRMLRLSDGAIVTVASSQSPAT
jgi:sugar lactone lactonase YvrE